MFFRCSPNYLQQLKVTIRVTRVGDFFYYLGDFLNSLVIIFGKKEPKIEQDCEMAQFLPLGPQLLKYGRFLPKLSCHIVSLTSVMEGSGCGAVGRAVASNTRGPGFESSHRQLILNIYLLFTVNCL